jgi:hypothetical protein
VWVNSIHIAKSAYLIGYADYCTTDWAMRGPIPDTDESFSSPKRPDWP